ncbi:hypothetical protein D3C87_1919160 [compost metagenome]
MANKSYTVLSGSFRDHNNDVIGAGGTVVLPDDVAVRFRNQLLEIKQSPAPVAAPAKPSGAGKEGRDV